MILLIFQNSGIFISFKTSLSPNWVKGPKVVYHVSRMTEKPKSIFDRTLRSRVCF